jgi:hypothetical protein
MDAKIENLRQTVKQRLLGDQPSAIERVFDIHKVFVRIPNKAVATDSRTQDGDLGDPEFELPLIPENKLGDALGELQLQNLCKTTVSEIFRRTATDYSDQGMTFGEFSLACKFPSKIEEWLATLELPRLLTQCIPHDSEEISYDELEVLRNLDEEALTASMTVFAEQVYMYLRYF